MKIILLGYMASGKSTVGRLLSKKMKLNFIDLDAYIEAKEDMSVSEIFTTKGEIYFRKQEHFYLKELLNTELNFVLAVGGGTPCYAGNMNIIKDTKSTTSIYIKLSISSLLDRLQNEKTSRPLVAELNDHDMGEFIAKHLFERSYYYNQADILYSGDKKSKEKAVEELFSILNTP